MQATRQRGRGPTGDARRQAHVDAGALAAALRRVVRGEVRFDDGSRALYATDASNYRQIPIGVVVPRTDNDIVATVDLCRRFGAPLLARGGGTSLAGQCCNVAVVLDCAKYLRRVLEIDPERRLARVQPGTVLDDLRDAAERHQLTFGPDPATHDHNTLGGMIGNNSCGVHSIQAGMTSDNVEELEVLTYDGLRLRVGPTPEEELQRIVAAGGRRGEIYRRLRELRDRHANEIRRGFPDIPRRVSGYNLPALLSERGFNLARALTGSEGSCVTILEATLRLVHSPPHRALALLGYPDIYSAADAVPRIMAHGPIGLEGFDAVMTDDMRRKQLDVQELSLLPHGRGWLLVEFGGEEQGEAEQKAQALIDALAQGGQAPDAVLVGDRTKQARIWRVREAALGATAQVPGEKPYWPGWEDSAVAPERFGAYLRDLRGLLDRNGYRGSFYGHFGQGCLHTRIDFDLETAAGIRRFRSFVQDAADLVVRHGGSLSGEHGDGQSRAELLPRMFSPELMQAFHEFKAIWDPENRMNPGKVVAPHRVDENLRLGTGYRPPAVKTYFQFPDDGGSFARATLRCVGVGKCRREGGGTMCPSYMVTHEEEHSTRGRARLLFEMLQGEAIRGGWRDEAVRGALDLCLACKGCKGDCPVNVDMATYKAEFLSHYYARRLRPRSAYAFGLIYWWARLAAKAPGLANFTTQTPLLRVIAQRVAGVAPARHIPRFAARTFREQFADRRSGKQSGRRVILWPDTFNNHFHPETALAAVEVLETAGFRVELPRRSLCCGRPLYDYGFLGLAKKLLRQIVDELRPAITAGVPVVGLEPSCVAVFRDELVNLFPHDADARRLSAQTFLLSEFLDREAKSFELPRLRRRALAHGHCHHKAIMGMGAEQRLLRRLGLDLREPDDGCCGMAGAFGFEREHYDVSIRAGERVLLPAVRAANADDLIIADGFSCREQIEQTTGRHALHLAEVLRLALHEQRAHESIEPFADETSPANGTHAGNGHHKRTAALAGAAVALAGGAALAWTKRRRT
ncbi:MAG TPA: FAD-linked oxidase C-terminal domain-containing protein [Dehalococcoidia bacterium]